MLQALTAYVVLASGRVKVARYHGKQTGISLVVYFGDGAASQAITGVGFQATILFIFRLLGGAMHIKTAGMGGLNTHKADDGTIVIDGVDSFDVDGFTVSLGINASADVYIYIAMRDV